MKSQTIQCDPKVLMGKPVVAGTRISVEAILDELVAGSSIEQLLEAYPRLTEPGVRAALAYAGQVLKTDLVYPIVGEQAA